MAKNEKTGVAISSVIAAVFLTGSKLAIGLLTGSLGILSEAAHSGLDLLAAAMTWWAVTVSERPADKDHPYGHEKLENLSALFETLLLLLTCVWIIYEAISRLFFKTSHVEVNAWSYGVVIVAIAVDFSRSRALSKVAKKTRSAALEADALHFSSDIYSSLVVLGGLVSTQLGYPQADAIAALGVSLFVIWISFRLGKKAIFALTDRVAVAHVERAEAAAMGIPGVNRVYDVRVREAGAKHFVDLKVAVDRSASLTVAHEVTEAVEKALKGTFKHADVLVHAEPDERQPLGLTEEIMLLGEKLGANPHALAIHQSRGGLEVEMHIEWPPEMALSEAHGRTTSLEDGLRRSFPDVKFVHTHLECRGEQPPTRLDATERHGALKRAIEKGTSNIDGILGCRDVRIKDGEGRLWVSLTCLLPQDLTIRQAHDMATEVEETVRSVDERVGGVTVHTEPAEP